MTVSSTTSSIIYIGDGSTSLFDVPFRFLENSDLKLSIQATDGTVTNLVLNSDYTVTGANADNGGKVHLTHPVGNQAKLSILRVMDLLQETDYRENERFPAESHERALDKLTFEAQQLQAQLDRAVKVDVFSNADPDALIQEIEIVYDNLDNINIVVNDKSNIDTVATNISDVNTNVTNMADIKTNATNINSIKTNANNVADINLLAENMKDINTAVTNITAIQEAPTAATNAANSAIDSSNYANASAASAQAAQEALDNVHDLIATPIGTIFMSIYVDESLDIARRLNGQLISSTKFTGFRTWLNDVQTAFPSLFTTETNWQAEKTNSKLGQCGKFVIDDTAGTIRLPCVVNAQGLTDLQYLGTVKSESLPDAIYYSEAAWGTASGDAARSLVASKGGYEVNNTGKGLLVGTKQDTSSINDYSYGKLSASNSTYQDNAPVQQEAVQYPYYIQVATGVEETLPAIREYKTNVPYVLGDSKYFEANPYNASWLESNGQYNASTVYPDLWSQLQVELNSSLNIGDTIEIGGKTYVKRGLPVKLSTDTYDDYDFVVNTTDQTFRLPLIAERVLVEKKEPTTEDQSWYNLYSDGWLEQGGVLETSQATTVTFVKPYITTPNVMVTAKSRSTASQDAVVMTTSITLTSFDVSSGGWDNKGIFTSAGGSVPKVWSAQGYTNIPQNTTWNLYYYIGDTVQDASLINAGAVLGQLATKTNSVEAAAASMPSNRYIDLTLGASGSTYTAPANGWFIISGKPTADGGYCILDTNNYEPTYMTTNYTGWYNRGFIPVRKGQVMTLRYGNYEIEADRFKFIYAEGEK